MEIILKRLRVLLVMASLKIDLWVNIKVVLYFDDNCGKNLRILGYYQQFSK